MMVRMKTTHGVVTYNFHLLVGRIGFVTTAMIAFEGDSARLSIAVLGNIVLGRNVVVRFSTADGTALSK